MRGVKQWDHGIGDTFVSSVLVEVFFRFDRFSGWMEEKSGMPQVSTQRSRYQSMGDTIVQLRGPSYYGSIVAEENPMVTMNAPTKLTQMSAPVGRPCL
jgi:hypothetical protein